MCLGTCDFHMKKHVSVPGMSRIPWNSLPNSFAKLCTHILLYLSDFDEMSIFQNRAGVIVEDSSDEVFGSVLSGVLFVLL